MFDNTITNYLVEKYQPTLMILYGSYYNNMQNEGSDVDIIVFAPINEFVHDSSTVNGRLLDAWIYPENEVDNIDKIIHILPCKILIDKKNIGSQVINQIIIKRKEQIKKLTENEKEQLNKWIEKMIKRSKQNTIEGNYRYNWLIHDFPELYCQYQNEYYDGPIKTINRMRESNIELYNVYSDIVNKEKDIGKLEYLFKMLKNNI